MAGDPTGGAALLALRLGHGLCSRARLDGSGRAIPGSDHGPVAELVDATDLKANKNNNKTMKTLAKTSQ
jgi:hypothetical protein